MCFNRQTAALMLSGFFTAKAIWYVLSIVMGLTMVVPELGLTIGGSLNITGFFLSTALALLTFKAGAGNEKPSSPRRISRARKAAKKSARRK